MLVLHYQVHGEENFPKLFSYEKLFVRFAKYQNAKRAHCTKSESTKVPKFCTDIRLFKWAHTVTLKKSNISAKFGHLSTFAFCAMSPFRI